MGIQAPKSIVEGVTINNSNQTLYTVTANTQLMVTHATLCNTTNTPRLVTIWAGPSATDATMRFKRTVAAYDTVEIDGLIGKMIPSASLIIAVADAAAAVSVSIAGTEFTTP